MKDKQATKSSTPIELAVEQWLAAQQRARAAERAVIDAVNALGRLADHDEQQPGTTVTCTVAGGELRSYKHHPIRGEPAGGSEYRIEMVGK